MFNVGLYREGLRKTRTLACLFLAVMVLVSIFVPVSQILDYLKGIKQGWGVEEIYVYGLDGTFMSMFALFVGAPIITLSMFSFLNKRSSSDFYHAIAHKRETLFASFIAATLTWVVGGMWLSTTISLLIYGAFPYATVDFTSVLLVIIGLSAACLLVIAVTALAMAITGTSLSNIITALLILFLPRSLVSFFIFVITSNALIVSNENFGLFGNFTLQIPIGIFTLSGSGETIHQMIINGTLYTFTLGLIYLVVAGVLFKRRQSEIAANPASRFTQSVIRIIVTFIITLPAIAMMVESFNDSANESISVIATYLVALVIYFGYEFVAARKLPKFIEMIPGIMVVVALNLFFILGLNLSQTIILREIIPTEVSSAIIIDTRVNHWSHKSYADLNLANVAILDEAINEFLSESLNENIRMLISSDSNGSDWWEHREVRVEFNMDSGRTMTRNVRIFEPEIFTELLIGDQVYRDTLLTLPDMPDDIFFEIPHGMIGRDLSEEQMRVVYDLLLEEVSEVDFETWHHLIELYFEETWHHDFYETSHTVKELEHSEKLDDFEIYAWIEVSGVKNGQHYTSVYPLTELTPRTLERFLSYLERES